MIRRPPRSTLFPYTRSSDLGGHTEGFDGFVPPGQTKPVEGRVRSEEHTSELQSRLHLVCRLLLEKKKKTTHVTYQSHITHKHTPTALICHLHTFVMN